MIKLYVIVWAAIVNLWPCLPDEKTCDNKEPISMVEFTTNRDEAIMHLSEDKDVFQVTARGKIPFSVHFHVKKLSRKPAYKVTASTEGVRFRGAGIRK